jgi:MoxR-like ATPase
LWIDYPTLDKELQIVRTKVPGIQDDLARQVARFVERARGLGLDKVPGISETLDWARAMVILHYDHLDHDTIEQTLGALIKDADDLEQFRQRAIDEILSKI